MSQRYLNFGPLPTGTMLITPSGELLSKNGETTAISADPEFGEISYDADEEVQVDVETTMSGLLRNLLMTAVEITSPEHATALADAERFMTLIGEL